MLQKQTIVNPNIGIGCSLHPTMDDNFCLIAPWWFDYRESYKTNLVVYDLQKYKIHKIVPGHSLFPVHAFWIDGDKRAISGDCFNEVICWDCQSSTESITDTQNSNTWPKLFVIHSHGIQLCL